MSAAAPTGNGWLYLSGSLTPYDVENLYEQILTLGRPSDGDVHVQVELGSMARNGPEVRALASRMRRLRRQGVNVHLHTARTGRKTEPRQR